MKAEIGVMSQLTTKDCIDDLKFVIENGFKWFELGLDWEQNFNLSNEKLSKIKKMAKDNNIKLIVHSAWYLPTSSMLPEIKKGVITNIKKAIIIAKKVGADRLTIHPGYREMPGPAIALCYNSLTDTLNQLVEFASRYKVNICLENVDALPCYLCYTIEDYLKVLNSVKGLKTTLDVGHANTSDGAIEYLEAVKNTIMDMHVHDNSGENDEHKCLGEGNIDFKRLFSECKKIGYNGPFILELFPYENILKGKERLEKLWEQAG
jgi:sugar phosphate isomerase/epimerase